MKSIISLALCNFLISAGLCVLLLSSSALAEALQEPVDREFVAYCDGTVQKYVLILPGGELQVAHDLLIALHGHGSDRWQFATHDRDETRAVRDVAEQHQMILACPDYRATTSWMGPAAEADMVQLIALLKQRYPVQRVLLCGGSMGGSSALTFAALHPDLVDGVVAMNGTANHLEFENFQDAIRRSFGGSKQEKTVEYKKRSAEYWPERFTMPIGLTTGGKDETVPPQSVQRLAGVLRQLQKDLLHIHRESGGHATNYEDARKVLEYVVDKMETP
ncbi:alpha/beta fold hydrolase [Bremerella cremea]|uniref:Alpha/beta fold hydrolase n=1 Tax=Bremerella cremea TaxID=1031537 RepID=A0A368KUJ8_9BACT|nr:alpha/beta fold hydrolase [Bremerella cremea]RCS54103.1 alpha/beta fold hydrolase [Bremerella cremea]